MKKLTDIKNHYYSVLRKAIRLIKSWRFQQDPHIDALMLLATEVGLANQHLAYYNELLLEILRGGKRHEEEMRR